MAKMQAYKSYKWEKDKLYLFSKDTDIYIKPHPDFPNSWALCWKDEMHPDIFNRSWGKDIGIAWHQGTSDGASEKLRGAFKWSRGTNIADSI